MEPPVCCVTADKAHTLVTDLRVLIPAFTVALFTYSKLTQRVRCTLKSRRKWKREREGNGWYFSRWWNLLRFIMMVSSPTWYGFVTHAMVWYWQMPQILFLSRLSDFAVVNTCCCTKICSEEEIACLFKRTLGFSKRPSLETFYGRF